MAVALATPLVKTIRTPTLLASKQGCLHSHDTTARAGTGIASKLAVGVVAQTQVVLAGMHHQAPAQDRPLAVERNDAVGNVDDGRAVRVGLDVAQVANVPVVLGLGGRTVAGVVRVEVAASGKAARARDVAVRVDVEAVQRRGREAVDLRVGVSDVCFRAVPHSSHAAVQACFGTHVLVAYTSRQRRHTQDRR